MSPNLESGTRLGNYEILGPIGSGGMGEVYRAKDTRLEREVALKLLPSDLANRESWLARFEREARMLAALNHPRIAILHGLERTEDGQQFLVMELVRGETLADRIARGPLTVEAALPIFDQVADALACAHEQGIIHRDLKPANIKITPEENVKVLDFGLAKPFGPESDPGHASSEARTMTRGSTIPGLIIGTAAYMSPEQARGEALDRRTDIWSFGCSFYEALTARRLFDGGTVSDTMAAALTKEVDWSLLPSGTPRAIRRLLRRCLERDKDRRLHDIADARIEIEESMLRPSEAFEPFDDEGAAPESRTRKGLVVLFGVLGLALGGLLGALGGRVATETLQSPASAKRLSIPLAPGETVATGAFGSGRPAVALSEDGRYLSYVTRGEGETELMLRRLDELNASPVTDSRGATSPFFSPAGDWLGFSTEGTLKRISPTGDVTVEIPGVDADFGASWTSTGGIVFSSGISTGLSFLPTETDKARRLTSPESDSSDRGHRWPQVLPGDEHALFTSWSGSSAEEARVEAVDLATGERRVLVEGGSFGRFASSGHLLYTRGSVLFAVPFDGESLELEGPAVPVLKGVRASPTTGAAQFSVSGDGTLVYVPGDETSRGSLAWVDRSGQRAQLEVEERAYDTPRLSPDGEHIAATVIDESGQDVWIYDTERGTFTRLTFEGNNSAPVWSPEGDAVIFASDREGVTNLFRRKMSGSDVVERLTTSEFPQAPTSWSASREALVFQQAHPETGMDLWIWPLAEEGAEPEPLIATEFDEHMGEISPDGRWLAYVSDESGRSEVYLRALDELARKWLVSSDGGVEPMWAESGDLLYFRSGDEMMVVEVAPGAEMSISSPESLFETEDSAHAASVRTFDADGDRFLMAFSDWQKEATEIRIVLNWFPEVDSLARPEREWSARRLLQMFGMTIR